MVRALVITEEVRTAIKTALELAAANPISLEMMKKWAAPDKMHIKLEDRKPETPTIVTRSQHVDIPMGYRAAISYEWQPIGLCKHLSISVDKKGSLPSPESVAMIAEEFGIKVNFSEPNPNIHIWVEEFDPGHDAVNLVTPVVT